MSTPPLLQTPSNTIPSLLAFNTLPSCTLPHLCTVPAAPRLKLPPRTTLSQAIYQHLYMPTVHNTSTFLRLHNENPRTTVDYIPYIDKA